MVFGKTRAASKQFVPAVSQSELRPGAEAAPNYPPPPTRPRNTPHLL